MLHEIIQELRHLDVSRSALQKFGWLIGGLLLAFGLWLLFKSDPTHQHFWYLSSVLGLILFTLGTFFPTTLTPVYRIWMGLAFVMGAIMSRVILTLVFFLLVTPIGLVMRLFRKDLLHLHTTGKEHTFWQTKTYLDDSPKRFEKYF